MSDVLEKTALYREAQSQPRPYDPEGVKREVQILVDDVVVQLPGGVRAPALIPGEHNARYAARADEVLIPFLPPERRDINRRALPFRDVAEILRVDLELARKEIDNPNFSLADGEIREVIRLDDAGRPITTWHTKTEGCRWWLDQFADPVRRYVSRGSQRIMTPEAQRSPNHDFRRDNLPEVRELMRRQAYLDSAEGRLEQVYADLGLPCRMMFARPFGRLER